MNEDEATKAKNALKESREKVKKMAADVAGVIRTAIDRISAAIATAQGAEPGTAHKAIDELDAQLQDTMAGMAEAATHLKQHVEAQEKAEHPVDVVPADPNAPPAPPPEEAEAETETEDESGHRGRRGRK